MKRSIVEVLLYLLQAAAICSADQDDSFADQMVIKQRLEDAGFAKDVVSGAFDWLKELIEQQCWYATTTKVDTTANSHKTIRVFNPDEQTKISVEVRNFILSLERSGILDTKMREIVICQLLQLNQRQVDLFEAKWVVLLVLMSKSNRNIQDIRNYLLITMAIEV